MQTMTLQQIADYFEDATIDETIDAGHALIQRGTNAAGTPFVLVNDMQGNSALTEGM